MASAGSDSLATLGRSIVILACRCWQAGHDHENVDCWHYAWCVLAKSVGPCNACRILGPVSDLIGTLREISAPGLECYPLPCSKASPSEQAILDLLEAVQKGNLDTRRRVRGLCGKIEDASVRRLLEPARELASNLITMDMHLGSPLAPIT